MVKRRNRGIFKKIVCLALTGVMLFGEGTAFGAFGGGLGAERVSAAGTVTVTSMEYLNAAQAHQSASGVGTVSFWFDAPKFNGKDYKELDLAAAWDDLALEEKQADGTWANIDQKYNSESPYTWKQDWAWELGNGSDNYGFWIKLDHSATVRLRSLSNPDVTLEYELNFNELPKKTLTSVKSNKNEITLSAMGGGGIHWGDGDRIIAFNEGSVTYDQIVDDLDILVNNDNDDKDFVQLLGNAASGFIWDSNFGIYTDGGGGLWFNGVDWSFTVRFQSKSNPSVVADVKVVYVVPDRSNTTLSPNPLEGQVVVDPHHVTCNDAVTGGNEAALCIKLPLINGTAVVKTDLDRFVFQICADATYADGQWTGEDWIPLQDANNWLYQDSGYNQYSAQQQWGYDVAGSYGLWFKPVSENTYLRIGYKEADDSLKDDNWIYYTIIGNPNAEFPDVSDMEPIDVDKDGEPSGDVTDADADQSTPEGWKMIWHDEFNGSAVNEDNWTNQTGFLLDENDASTFGWGNKELEHYTDSPENTSVADGKLKLTLKKDRKVFEDTKGNTAEALYSSGKLVSQHKFSVKYGRVDFRAKLPDGNGIWPALWMMPNDDIYGSWAMSGEIDVFEGRGRTPEIAYGTLHYGSTWPSDKESGDKLNMVSDKRVGSDMTNWHVYSIIWEEDCIKMYVDGICYMRRKADSWYSAGASDNPYAPFDQRFYLIMNLAVGGYFDGLNAPDYDTFTDKEMFVDYVRVYQRMVEDGEDEKNDTNVGVDTDGKNDKLYGDFKLGKVIPATGLTLDKDTLSLSAGTSETLTATVEPSNATNKSITWTSSDESVATVKNGVVKALKTGSATITAKLGDFTKTCAVTVTGINVTGISLDKTTLSLNTGETGKLTATIAPANASNKGVSWSSSDKTVATVAEDGTVTAIKAGETTITATAEGGNFKASCKVTVTKEIIPVASISLNKTTLSLKTGGSETLTAQVLPQNADNKSVTWSSSNERVATVTNGKVTALKMGEVVITATTVDGAKTAQCTVTVTDGDSASGERQETGCEIKDGNIIIYEKASNIIFHTFIDSADATIDQGKVGADATTQNGEYWEHVITGGAATYADKYLAYWFNVSPTPVIVKVSDIPNADAPAATKYTIKFYQQNIAGDGYDLVATEFGSGAVGEEVAPEAITYPGFTLNQDAPGSKTSGVIAEGDSLELAFYYDRNTYKYTYVYNNGAADKEGSYTYGVGIASLEQPVRDGYTFDGWYTEDTFVTKVTAITGSMTKDVTLYAKWKENKAPEETVTYTGRGVQYKDGKLTFYVADMPEGVTGAKVYYKVYASKEEADEESSLDVIEMESVTLTYDETAGCWMAAVEEELSEEDYLLYAFDFTGSDEAGIGDWNMVPGSVVLSGQIEIASYKVEYYQQNESGDDYTCVAVETKKGIVGAIVKATVRSYTGFVYNEEVQGAKASGDVTADGALVLKLYYDRENHAPEVYAITYNLNGGTQNAANPSTYTYGTGVAELKAPTRNGYTFDGWYENASFTGEKVTSISGSRTGAVSLYAKWTANAGGGSEKVDAVKPAISKNPQGGSYEYKTDAVLSVAATISDKGVLSYQWYRNTKNSTAGAEAISGANGTDYQVPTTEIGTFYYFCRVTNTNSGATGEKTAVQDSAVTAVTVVKATNPIMKVSSYTAPMGSKVTLKPQGSATYKVTSGKKYVKVSKSGKVTFRSVGKATITVTAKGNDYYKPATKKIKFTVTPKTPKVSYAKSLRSKTAAVKWKKISKATKYEVQYSTDKSFKKGVKKTTVKGTSTTLKKLTGGKKYYVRVRACTKTIKGTWSKAKSVKVKK